jgi:pimeloyl-ACP methyl ester carboxylesterase
MDYEIKTLGKFKYIEEGEGEPLVLLHGLFGALSNFRDLLEHFRKTNKVVIPMLPLFDLNILETTVSGLAKYVHKFVETLGCSATPSEGT